jgi:1-aminocyclopropane-1-carboxylate deaminase/D-cysteine desulfhydrase-like pyridoxal-dependent ACC family enzyme
MKLPLQPPPDVAPPRVLQVAVPAVVDNDVARLAALPRVELGRWPTPIEPYQHRDLGAILVKRDDLSGWGRGGAKARKIEQLIGHLLAHGYDELITVAGNVTNLAFDLLPALDRHGIRSTLFIQDDPPTPAADRERIFAGIRKRVRLLGTSRARTLQAAAGAYLRSRARGGRPLMLFPGASHPAGVVGNACGFLEMVEQRLQAGAPLPGTVFVTAATGTTVAGFLLAESALRRAGCRPIQVVGVQIYPGPVERWTLGLVRWTERFARFEGRMPPDRIRILHSTLHGGFGDFPDALASLCERVAGEGGPRIDPIFGGKTWAAMQHHLRDRGRDDRPILYWHCGYTPEWQTLGSAVRRGKETA